MKRALITVFAIISLLSTSVSAYTIGGAYASLISCSWGQWGYEYGNIGTYDVNGKIYQVFFGSNYYQH